jgi:flagellar motor switch protein FliG
MADTPPSTTAKAAETAAMSKVQKLAALLVLIGPESAAQVLKGLGEEEIETVTAEMAKIGLLSQEVQREVLREFTDVAVQASTALRGGADFANSALERAVGVYKASNIMGRVAPSRAPGGAIQQMAELESGQVFNLIKHEQPQMIALVLSQLSADKASRVLAQLRAEIREEVVERLAGLGPTPIEVIETVVGVLNQKLGTAPARAIRHSGGVKAAAALLNALDKDLSKTLLGSIEERRPELGRAIRQKMFTIEDVAGLDSAALQKILREVDMRDLAMALKSASERLKSALLGCISKRAAETVNEEMSLMGTIKQREIEAAQIRIVDVVRRLEAEGEIELSEPAQE